MFCTGAASSAGFASGVRCSISQYCLYVLGVTLSKRPSMIGQPSRSIVAASFRAASMSAPCFCRSRRPSFTAALTDELNLDNTVLFAIVFNMRARMRVRVRVPPPGLGGINYGAAVELADGPLVKILTPLPLLTSLVCVFRGYSCPLSSLSLYCSVCDLVEHSQAAKPAPDAARLPACGPVHSCCPCCLVSLCSLWAVRSERILHSVLYLAYSIRA